MLQLQHIRQGACASTEFIFVPQSVACGARSCTVRVVAQQHIIHQVHLCSCMCQTADMLWQYTHPLNMLCLAIASTVKPCHIARLSWQQAMHSLMRPDVAVSCFCCCPYCIGSCKQPPRCGQPKLSRKLLPTAVAGCVLSSSACLHSSSWCRWRGLTVE
jgi:hypothetical protein